MDKTIKEEPAQQTLPAPGSPEARALVDKLHALPVYAHKDDILAALETSPVIVVESTTGSGKTTQLPVILHEAGYTKRGIVGMTQPRRIAAFSTADIIRMQALHVNPQLPASFAEYKIRFDDPTTQDTRIKIMTDGVLLQEIKHAPFLQEYSVIIVDEAHERSLNIDFALGLLRGLVEKRPDLKIIISSATINSAVFSDFFFGCPVVSIDAPLHDVELRYIPPVETAKDKDSGRRGGKPAMRPLHQRADKRTDKKFSDKKSRGGNDEEKTGSFAVSDEALVRHTAAIADASVGKGEGDMLIFMSGEKQIKMCWDALLSSAHAKSLHILPLYGRLDKATQARVFEPAPKGKTKVVIATNIAETSITIDGIAVVIDTGRSKVNSFLHSKFASVLEELPISQASAIQRCGRAGRTQSGICYRLFSKTEFSHMNKYTQEEIHRTDLSEVVLRMAQLGIAEFEDFPFISPPQKTAVHAAVKTLQMLGALDREKKVTSVGEVMGDFPLSPMHARIVIEAMRNYPDILHEILAIISFLTTPNPFLLPLEEMTEARAAHRSFASKPSDFALYLELFNQYSARPRAERESFCARYYLDAQIMDEIFNVCAQLGDIVASHGVLFSSEKSAAADTEERLMKAMLSGFYYNVCLRDTASRASTAYVNRSAERIFVHPGSVLFDEKREKLPTVIVAGEVVNTSKYFARSIAPCKVEWLKDIYPDIYDAALQVQKLEKKNAASFAAKGSDRGSEKGDHSRGRGGNERRGSFRGSGGDSRRKFSGGRGRRGS